MPILWLEVDDLESAHHHIVQQNVRVIEFHESQSILIVDPDGLFIEAWQTESEQ